MISNISPFLNNKQLTDTNNIEKSVQQLIHILQQLQFKPEETNLISVYDSLKQSKLECHNHDHNLQKINELFISHKNNNTKFIQLLKDLLLKPLLVQYNDLVTQIITQLESDMHDFIGSITTIQVDLVLRLHPGLTIINKDELTELNKNKIIMETKISELKNTNNALIGIITKKDLDIDNLKKENEHLKTQLELAGSPNSSQKFFKFL